MAHWNVRHFKHWSHPLHFVPLYPDSNTTRGELVPAHYDRPTLCGLTEHGVGNGTTQDDIVSCLGCAIGIESDRQRWVYKRKQHLITEDNMTWCSSCGGVLGLPPGCHCNDTVFDKIKNFALSKIR
jgi:hypothetical protein